MITASFMADHYKDGRYVNRWTLVRGLSRCVAAPLDVTTADLATIAAQLAVNRVTRELQARVDAYDAAWTLSLSPEPAETLPTYDEAGEVSEDRPNPAHAAWVDACQALADAPDDLLHLVRTREDTLVLDDATGLPAEAPFDLVLPALPPFDPATETVDLVAGAWSTPRPVTETEAATWRALMVVRWPRAMTPRDAVVLLLTPAKWLAVSTSADPAVQAARQAALGANMVDLDSPATAETLAVFKGAGLLTAERVAAILTGERVA